MKQNLIALNSMVSLPQRAISSLCQSAELKLSVVVPSVEENFTVSLMDDPHRHFKHPSTLYLGCVRSRKRNIILCHLKVIMDLEQRDFSRGVLCSYLYEDLFTFLNPSVSQQNIFLCNIL